MAPTETMLRARALLLVVLSFLDQGVLYTMNLCPSHDHSLARRLGFCINEEYYGFLVAAGLAGYFVNTRTGTKSVAMTAGEWKTMLENQPTELFEVVRAR
jgi:hypothetical protein